jgi:hypothetical protein
MLHAKRNQFFLQLFGVLANVTISGKLPLLECFFTTTVRSNHEWMITGREISGGERESEKGLPTPY